MQDQVLQFLSCTQRAEEFLIPDRRSPGPGLQGQRWRFLDMERPGQTGSTNICTRHRPQIEASGDGDGEHGYRALTK